MVPFILIIQLTVYPTGSYSATTSITTQEFNSQETCEYAMNLIKERIEFKKTSFAICVKK